MRFFTRSLIGLFLASVTVALLALSVATVVDAVRTRFAERPPGADARERVFAATVVTAWPERARPVMTTFGEIRARRMLELRAPRAGTIAWLAEGVEDGAAVSAGQLILRFDPADAIAARDLAAADLAEAQAEAAEADRALALSRDELAAAEAQARLRAQALARQEDLRKRGVGSDAAVEAAALAASAADQAVLAQRAAASQAQTRVELARTTLDRGRISLAEAERALAETELRAAFAGRLAGVSVVPGGVVGAHERLGDLIDPDRLEVAFRLSAAQFARLVDADGALLPLPVSVSLDVPGAGGTATGRLARVGAAVGEGQTGRLVYATLEDARGLRPGDFVSVRIEEPALDGAIVLPAAALGPQGTVLVLGEDDRLAEETVEVLRRQDDQVILRAPALTGREVVAERTALLGPGLRLRPVRPGADAADGDATAMVDLTPARRADLIARVQSSDRLPAEAKATLLQQLSQDRVPARLIERIEQRMGG